jgi:hypothetical protein
MKVRDAQAEALEAAGLYRRAARRWLEVFDKRVADVMRDWLRQRRNACLRRMPVPKTARDALSYREVSQAADAALRRMGMTSACGGSDWHKDKEDGVDKV